MKQCPVCKSIYQDDSLTFCLSDGAKLVTGSSEPVTQQMSFPLNQQRINIPVSEPTVVVNSGANQQPAEPRQKSYGFVIGLIVTAFVIAGIAIIAVFAYITAVNSGKNSNVTSNVNPSPTATSTVKPSPLASASPESDKEKDQELKQRIEQLEKELAEQKKNGKNVPNSTPGQSQNPTSSVTAKVNSPNDGFLALRSEPSTQRGSQILKIPHGAIVSLQNCEKTATTISGRSGRWCEVEYNGNYGWVFSAWLDWLN